MRPPPGSTSAVSFRSSSALRRKIGGRVGIALARRPAVARGGAGLGRPRRQLVEAEVRAPDVRAPAQDEAADLGRRRVQGRGERGRRRVGRPMRQRDDGGVRTAVRVGLELPAPDGPRQPQLVADGRLRRLVLGGRRLRRGVRRDGADAQGAVSGEAADPRAGADDPREQGQMGPAGGRQIGPERHADQLRVERQLGMEQTVGPGARRRGLRGDDRRRQTDRQDAGEPASCQVSHADQGRSRQLSLVAAASGSISA